MKSTNYSGMIPTNVPYRSALPLTNQVPYLSNTPSVGNDERWGFLPFIGGLAVGGLLFGGGGWGGRPCCGGYQPPVYYQQPIYYSQPAYYQQPVYPMGYQQQSVQNGYYGTYAPVTPTDTTVVENNKYYIS